MDALEEQAVAASISTVELSLHLPRSVDGDVGSVEGTDDVLELGVGPGSAYSFSESFAKHQVVEKSMIKVDLVGPLVEKERNRGGDDGGQLCLAPVEMERAAQIKQTLRNGKARQHAGKPANAIRPVVVVLEARGDAQQVSHVAQLLLRVKAEQRGALSHGEREQWHRVVAVARSQRTRYVLTVVDRDCGAQRRGDGDVVFEDVVHHQRSFLSLRAKSALSSGTVVAEGLQQHPVGFPGSGHARL